MPRTIKPNKLIQKLASEIEPGDFIFRGNMGLMKVSKVLTVPGSIDLEGNHTEIELILDDWYHIIYDVNSIVKIEK